MLTALSLACLTLAQDPAEDLPVLRVGETIEGEVADGDPLVHTPTLDKRHTDAPVVGKTFVIEIEEPGPHWIELRAYLFDAYLVLRDEEGRVLAEDDDSAVGTHARVTAGRDSPAFYFVDACALHGERGAFELQVQKGRPPVLSRGEEQAAERAELERTIAIENEVLGPDHLRTATSLHNLAGLLRAQGDYAAARPLLERALAIREKALGPAHRDTAELLNDLGVLLLDAGDYAAARPLYERALAILEKELGPEHPDTFTVLTNLALLLTYQGDYAAARPLCERALAFREKALGPEHLDTVTSLSNLAVLLRAQGDYAAARPLLERVAAIREKVLGPEHPSTALALNNLAVLLQDQGDDAGARPLLERALEIWENTLGPEHPQTARCLNNLAALLSGQGDYAAARPYLERALAIREKTLGPQHPDTALSLHNLAVLLRALGEDAAARPCYERALVIREKVLGREHPATAWSLHDLAILLWDASQPEEAWDCIARAWAASRSHQRRLLASLSEAESYAYLATVRDHLETLLSLAPLLSTHSFEAYDPVLVWKGQVLRQLLASRERLLASLTERQRDLVRELRSAQAQVSQLAFQREISDHAAHEERLEELCWKRDELELQLQRSDKGEAFQEVSFQGLRASLPRDSALIDFLVHRGYRPARHEGEKVVENGARQEPRLSAWITRGDLDRPVQLDLGQSAAVEAAVKSFLADLVAGLGLTPERGIAVARSKQEEDSNDLLRALLWDPIAPYLAGVDTLFISPDGFLGTLPLETLQLGDGSYLLERYSFVYLQDPTSLVGMEEHEAALDSLLSLGGVNYKDRTVGRDAVEASKSVPLASAFDLRSSFGSSWAALPFTAQESEVVYTLHENTFEKGRRLLLQEAEATEERLKQELSGFSVVHLATHGFFNPEGVPSLWEAALAEAQKERPLSEETRVLVGRHPGLLTGLVCAGANVPAGAGRDDGYLTAEEVGWLDLSKVELVVLSACETGLGRAQSGEGLLGLRRAFELSGAKTVISSLWSVKDESTSHLMQRFYENLWGERQGRAEALRNAQLEMLAKNRAEHGDALPATWGAFVLAGEWR